MSQQAAGFTDEQQDYLVSVLTNLNLHRAFQGGGASAEPEEETYYGVPLEDLCKEEMAKYTQHPLDVWSDLVRWEATGHMAEGLEQFRTRHYGFFNVAPNSEGYMMRLRTPACVLRGDQMVVLGDLAEEHAGGYSHVTTRGSLQLREIQPGSVLPIVERMAEVGLTSQGTGADSARNLTVSPTAGFDAEELIDMTVYAKRLSRLILNTRELQGIPRKFNISFDNGGTISCVSDTNDICFLAVDVQENDQGVAPGIWCRISLGGITGHKDFARDTGMVCRPEDTVAISEAMLRVFVEHGCRTNRGKARLKYVLDANGFDWFIERTREMLETLGSEAEILPLDITSDAPRATIKRQAHIGVHKQRQDGLNYVGVALEVGRMSADQMRGLGRIAAMYGSNDIRLTVWQNPLIVGVPDDQLERVEAELQALELTAKATAFAAGAVACTGKWGCKFGLANTKRDATELVRHLESLFTLDQPINIHLTGCPNSCAQHYIGDIGLVGSTAPDGGEGYNILLGGGSDLDQGLARPLCGPVASADVKPILEHVVASYLARRAPDQSFLDFTRSLDEAGLKTLLPPELAAAA